MQAMTMIRWPRLLARLFGVRRRSASALEEPLYFTRLKGRSDAEWQAALARDPETAARWVYAAATYGDIDAQLQWAQMLLQGHGTACDPEGAFRWFAIAAKSGRPEALNMLGRCHERGWGVAVDFAEAAACYRPAAEKGSDWAQFNFACLLLDGRGVTQNPDAAFALFKRAAAQGHVKSMTMLGRCHEHGHGVPADPAAALAWYRRAAEGGDFRGQYCLGLLLFERGMGEEALGWLGAAVKDGPVEFCRAVADELIGSPHEQLQDVAAAAQLRININH